MNEKTITVKGFLKKLIGFSTASWLSAGISFLTTPFFTRLYAPEQTGRINMFIAFMNFFQTFSVFALDQAFMRFYNEDIDGLCKNNLLRYCLRINLFISCISAIFIFSAHSYIAKQIAGENIWLIPVCLVIVMTCGTFLRMSSVSSRMEGNIIQYSLQIVLISFVEKIVCTITALYKPTYRVAIISITLGFICISILFFALQWKKMFFPISSVPRQTTKIILRFAVPYLPVVLLNWLNGSIPLFALRRFVDYSSIGIYTNAVTISNIVTLIQTGFSTYWNPFIYENYNKKENIQNIHRIVTLVIFAIFVLSFSVILFQDTIYLLVGEKYRASKGFFPFLMFAPICSCLGDITGIGIMLSKKTYLNVITFSSCTFVNIFFSFLLVPKIGIVGAGIAVMIAALVMLVIRSWLAMRYYKTLDNNWKIIWPVFLMIGVCIINGCLDGLPKYVGIFVMFLLLCIAFKNEVKYLFQGVIKGISHICK